MEFPISKLSPLSGDIDRDQFGLELKTWRLRQGKTQREVAALWGCSRYTIMRAEAGQNITWEMAYKLFSKLSAALRDEGHEVHNSH